MTEQTSIILNLENASDVIDLDYNQVFQTEARASIFEKIKNQLEAQEKSTTGATSNSLFYDRHHNAITVSGSRGSGKSTFLRHILTCLDAPEGFKFVLNKGESIPEGLQVLKIIDPTLISSKEHVLILLISQIRDVVNNSTKNIPDDLFRGYEASLKKLAGGLCQIDGIGPTAYGDEWEDKTYILEKGLQKATEGRNLECNLNEFIITALKALDKKAFVITFDDIDTKFEKGWPVLETIRKYLTSQQLIILISGDIELYSTLVRGAQYKSLGEDVTKFDRPSSQYHKNSLTSYEDDRVVKKASELEEQYLMKVLKPENRVHMLTLHQKAARLPNYRTNIELVPQLENNDSVDLESFINHFLVKFYGITKGEVQYNFKKGLLSLPIRTLLQFFKAINDNLIEQNTSVNEPISFSLTRKSVGKFTSAILNIFGLSFSSSKINLSDIGTAEFSLVKLAESFFIWAKEKGYGAELKGVNLVVDNDVLNSQTLVLLTLAAKHTKFSPSGSLAWMFYGCLPKELDESSASKNLDVKSVLDYLGINEKSTSILETASRATLALLVGDAKGVDKGAYTIPGYNKISFETEIVLGKFYEFDKVNAAYEALNEVDKSNSSNKRKIQKRTKIRLDLKEQFHSAIYQRENFDDAKDLAGWLNQLKTVYDNNADIEKEVVGYFYNTKESIEKYDLGYLFNLFTCNAKGYKVGYETTFASILPLIGAMSCLLEDNIEDERSIEAKLVQYSLKNKYLMPIWHKGENSQKEASEEVDDEKPEFDRFKYKGDFYSRLLNWIRAVQKNWSSIEVSSVQLIDAFERYLDNISEIKRDKSGLGTLLHKHIVALLQHLMFTDAVKEGKNNLSPRSIAGTEREFHLNYRKFLESEFHIYQPEQNDKSKTVTRFNRATHFHRSLVSKGNCLFSVIFSCPIIGLMLRNESDSSGWNWLEAHASCYLSFCEDKRINLIDGNVADELDKSLIQLNKVKDTAINGKKRKELIAKYYSEFSQHLEEYLGSLTVKGKLKNTLLTFPNLNNLVNSVIITSGKQNIGVELKLDESKLVFSDAAINNANEENLVNNNADDDERLNDNNETRDLPLPPPSPSLKNGKGSAG